MTTLIYNSAEVSYQMFYSSFQTNTRSSPSESVKKLNLFEMGNNYKEERNANYQYKQFLFYLLRQLSCNLPFHLLKCDSCHKHTAELDYNVPYLHFCIYI